MFNNFQSDSQTFNYFIHDRCYEVTFKPLLSDSFGSRGYLIDTYYYEKLIGSYQFTKNLASCEAFGQDENELIKHLFQYCKSFIDGWDRYKRVNVDLDACSN